MAARPLWARIGSCGVVMRATAIAGALMLMWGTAARARDSGLTDAQIADSIIQASRAAYYATGHPCACPFDRARNGSACGGRSAYSRPGGAAPKCYPQDVSKPEIEQYRRAHR
jgi:hypothetical protein